MRALLETLGRGLVELCYPRHCQLCASRECADETPFICVECVGQVPRIGEPRCARCSLPFDGEAGHFADCPHCRGFDWSFESAHSGVRLRGPAREVLHRFKYGRQIYWRALIGDWIREAAIRDNLSDVDLVVPVPLFGRREREREYNQAALLAVDFGRWMGLPVQLRALLRIRDTPTQTRLDRDERLQNQKGAFVVKHPERVAGCSVCLVDDVWTTGATSEECAKTLLGAGARKVRVLTAARG